MPVTTKDGWEILTRKNAQNLYRTYFKGNNNNSYVVIETNSNNDGRKKYYFVAKQANEHNGFVVIISDTFINSKLTAEKQKSLFLQLKANASDLGYKFNKVPEKYREGLRLTYASSGIFHTSNPLDSETQVSSPPYQPPQQQYQTYQASPPQPPQYQQQQYQQEQNPYQQSWDDTIDPPPPPNLSTEILENDSTTQAVEPPGEWYDVEQSEIKKIKNMYKKLHNYDLWGPEDLVWTRPIYITHENENNLLLTNNASRECKDRECKDRECKDRECKDVKKVNLSESYVLHGIKLAYEGDWYESGNDQENTESTILKGKKCSSKESRRDKNGKWKPSDLIKALTDAKGLLENLYNNNNLIGEKQVKTLNDVFENLKKALNKEEFLENVAEFFKDRKIYVNGIINSSGLIKSSSLVKKQLTESEFKAFQIKHFTRSFSERFIQQWFWIIGSYTNLLYEKIIKIEDFIEYSIQNSKEYDKKKIENEFETKLNACDKKFDNAMKKLLQRKNRKDHEASITSSAARNQLLECWNYLCAINNIIKKSDYSLYQEKNV